MVIGEKTAPVSQKVDVDVLLTMMRAGYSQADCAKHFGVAQPTIMAHVKRLRAKGDLTEQDTNIIKSRSVDASIVPVDEGNRLAIHKSLQALQWIHINSQPNSLREIQSESQVIGTILDNLRKASPNHQASAKNNRPMANIVQQVHGNVVNHPPNNDNPHKATVVEGAKADPDSAKHPPGG